MKEASWPIFIAAPFMRPSVSTICSAASRWRCSSACAASLGVAGQVRARGAGVAGALGAHHRADLGGAADAPLRNVGVVPARHRHRTCLRTRIAALAPPLHWPAVMADSKRPTLDVEERPERGTRATKRLRREGYVPGVVYGGEGRRLHLLQGRTRARCAHVLVDGSALIDLKVDGKTPPGDREGPAAAPGPRRAAPHRPARGPPRREDPDAGRTSQLEGAEEAPGVKEGGVLEHVTHELNIEALPTDIPDGDPRGRVRAWRSPRPCTSPRSARPQGVDVPRRPGGDDHRDGRRPDRGRGAGDRGGDRAGRRGRRAARGGRRARRGRGGAEAPAEGEAPPAEEAGDSE